METVTCFITALMCFKTCLLQPHIYTCEKFYVKLPINMQQCIYKLNAI